MKPRTVHRFWDVEQAHPWLLALYALAFVAAIAGSALWPMGWAS